jgi:hypothetical protein
LTAQQHHQLQNIISLLPLVATAMILPSLDQFFGAAYFVQAGAIAAAAHSNRGILGATEQNELICSMMANIIRINPTL